MTRSRNISSDTRGAAAIEFALIAPSLLLAVIGIFQISLGFYASAGLRNGVEAAARYAQIFPRPTDGQIANKLTSSTYGLNTSLITGPTLTHGTANGVNYVDISASYNFQLNFLFMPGGSVTLNHSRRAYQY